VNDSVDNSARNIHLQKSQRECEEKERLVARNAGAMADLPTSDD
jgi:hypothetical protein